MSRRQKAIYIGLLLIFILVLPFPGRTLQKNQEVEQIELEFTFETKGNYNFMVGNIERQDLIVIMPKDKYSKQNLELLFQYFSRKYPNKRQVLRVTVYAGNDAYEHRSDSIQVFGSDLRYQAYYTRVCNNEYYFYVSDLNEPKKMEGVILRGKIEPLERIGEDCN